MSSDWPPDADVHLPNCLPESARDLTTTSRHPHERPHEHGALRDVAPGERREWVRRGLAPELRDIEKRREPPCLTGSCSGPAGTRTPTVPSGCAERGTGVRQFRRSGASRCAPCGPQRPSVAADPEPARRCQARPQEERMEGKGLVSLESQFWPFVQRPSTRPRRVARFALRGSSLPARAPSRAVAMHRRRPPHPRRQCPPMASERPPQPRQWLRHPCRFRLRQNLRVGRWLSGRRLDHFPPGSRKIC